MTWTIILAALTGLAYPVFILLTNPTLKTRIEADPGARLADYKLTISVFWTLTVLILINIFSTNPLSIRLYPEFTTAGIVVSCLVLLFAVLQLRPVRITNENQEMLTEKLNNIYFYLPKSSKEYAWFILLSISAGICEEMIFRLFLFEFLLQYTHVVVAFLLANVLFAITHIGTGKKNLISTFVLGMVFSCIYYFTGNIWIAVALHSIIDIGSGTLGYKLRLFTAK